MVTTKEFGTAVISVAIIALVVNSFFGVAVSVDDPSGIPVQTIEPAPSDYTTTQYEGTASEQVVGTLRPTTSTAADLDTTAYFETPVDNQTYAGSYAIGLTVHPGSELSSADTASIYAANDTTLHLMLEEGQYTARHKSGSNISYVETNADLSTTTAIGVGYNNSTSTLSLYKNGNVVDTNQTTNQTVPHSHPVSWVGSITEIRAFDTDHYNGSSLAKAYSDDPRQALTNQTMRAPFNSVPDPNRAYYASGDIALQGGDAPLVDGIEPAVDAQKDVDFEIRLSDEIELRTTPTGYLAEQPVVIIGSGIVADSLIATIASVVGSGMQVLVFGTVVMAAAFLYGRFDEF